jgi:hypothetical protein
MADDQKDRLGNKLHDVEKAREDQFFQQRDRELIEKLRTQAHPAAAAMRCPKCGEELRRRVQHEVAVEACPACHGIWLAHGELERIAKREKEGWISQWLRSLAGI